MVLTLLTVGFLSFAEVPKPAPQVPFTEVFARDGVVVVRGKEFQATASRFTISADGKYLDLRGTDDQPATLMSRPDGSQNQMCVTGVRIVFSPSEGTMRVSGAGAIIEGKPKKK